MMRALWILVATVLCIAPNARAEDARILPESANIALVDGSAHHSPCEIEMAPNAAALIMPPHGQCVLVAIDNRALRIRDAYLQELHDSGWRLDSEEWPAWHFSRSTADGAGNAYLDMIQLLRGPPGDFASGVVLIFMLRDGPPSDARSP
ncbi:MAG: hypothetical protein KF779_14680 [Hyphomonadaceae bacterium]|nr:hypothetical protein [Hyphomonadaceae bacterium]